MKRLVNELTIQKKRRFCKRKEITGGFGFLSYFALLTFFPFFPFDSFLSLRFSFLFFCLASLAFSTDSFLFVL